MNESTRGYVAWLVCFLTVVIVWSVKHPTVSGEARSRAVGYRIDMNAADASTLELLPGVGPSIAENIVSMRRENGGFDGPGDLRAVRYVGPRLLERIEAWVTYGGSTGESVVAAK